ncbi:hypothetical protein [Chitinophaga sp. Cy-1792]|uniref:hypothetical protein n=1 Tax=Chitinophaga sp. Cy-1792 TaxID=2608339 RepID=UPI00141EB796|nr:hypothetical protein [Chitinophaga sp. Cy-1792]NIG54786.1 hypothetical protein [Chitinophaga sp. Cy-1792]
MRKTLLLNIILFICFLTGTYLVVHYASKETTVINPWIGRLCIFISCLLHLIILWAKNFGAVNHRIMVFQSWLVILFYFVAGFFI